MTALQYRLLKKTEVTLLSEIDRKEIVNQVYYLRSHKLESVNEYYDIKGWNSEEVQKYIHRLQELYDRNGAIIGVFDHHRIVGLGALDSKLIGRNNNQLKLDMIYISSGYRKKGIGRILVNLLVDRAKELGATSLYISATPFKNTVDFYFAIGAKLTDEINRDLYELEPNDIHMVLKLE
jgi:GNAT superfamily N-acetyltransferase